MAEIVNPAAPSTQNVDRLPTWACWTRELISICVWVAIPTKVFVFDFDVYLTSRFAAKHVWLLDYKFFGFVTILGVATLVTGRKWFYPIVGFVLAYPIIIAVWRIPKLIFRNWALGIAFAPAIHSIVKSLRKAIVWGAMALLAGFVISVFEERHTLLVAMIVLAICLCRRFYLDFHRAFRPSNVFTDLASFVRKLRAQFHDKVILEGVRKIANLDPASEQYKKEFQTNLLVAYVCNASLQSIAIKLKRVAEGRKLDMYFISSILYSFLLTVLVFGFEYWALWKIDSTSFKPTENLGFWDFLGFSFSTLMTASISPITPATRWAQAIGHFELLATFILLSIVITVIFSVVRERYRDDMEGVVAELNESAVAIASQIETDYQLTYDEIEERLIADSLSVVK